MFYPTMLKFVVLAATLFASPVAAVNRCGTSYSNAASKCSLCPNGTDGECATGETCYAGLSSCSPPPSSGGNVNRCGTSPSTVTNQCAKCPRGVDSECPSGMRCYAGYADCGSSTPPPSGGTCGSLNNPYPHKDKYASGRTAADAPGSEGWNPQTRFAVDKLKCQFPSLFGNKCGTYNSGGTSDHPGNAADCPPGQYGVCYSTSSTTYKQGWAAANWLKDNAVALEVSYVIYFNKIWSRARSSQGWRDYGYGACTTSNRVATNGHYDHIHISMYPSLA